MGQICGQSAGQNRIIAETARASMRGTATGARDVRDEMR